MSGPAACDYSFARPNPTTLRQAGYQAVCRYLAPLPNGKVVTAAETQAIWAAGLDLVLVWESYAQAASGGRPVGHSEGVEALRQADTLGWPADRPAYFVMEDPNRIGVSAWPAVEEYCRGLQDAGWPVERIGGYGSQALLEHLFSLHLISWGWQVEGWSTAVSALCHLYQRNAPTLAGPAWAGDIDEDAILKADFGGWRPGQNPGPGPAPTAAAAPATPAPAGPVGDPIPVPEQEHLMIQRFQTTTGADGTAYIDLPVPAGCSMLCGGWADVLDATAFNPPRHDSDIHAAHDDPIAAPNGVVCQPCVGGNVPAGHARLRMAGGAPNHFYTGKAVFA